METNESSSWFIGAQAENHQLFESILLDYLQDHMYWRRNFHPDDPPSISSQSAHSPENLAFIARMKDELYALSASLKSSIPLSSPRYMGHMISDPLIPGLLAQMLTLPYNPNNVSEEAAPVTIELEVKVGLQLARMIGYNDDPNQSPCAFGYLTAGGTLSNYQALQVLRSVKYYPLALQTGMQHMNVKPPPGGILKRVIESDPAELNNFSVDESIEAREAWLQFLNHEVPASQRATLDQAVNGSRIESLGTHAFFSLHSKHCSAPVVLVPETAHYSWVKAVRLLGIGESGLVRIPTRSMRMDTDALEHALAAAKMIGQTVLCVVGVLGTTEYGTFDPIHELVAARERWHAKGLGFAVHADAAWGGYLATLFRNGDGSTPAHEESREPFKYFPSEHVYSAFRDLALTDSATVDPHKLGYLPYGVGGAYVCRDHRCVDFIAADAPYLGRPAPEEDGETAYFRKFRRLGTYILEGSKPGAAAAAAYVTHRVLPLDRDHFGQLLSQSVQDAEHFYDRVLALRERIKDQVRISIPIEPDSNLVCIAFNPSGNETMAVANNFTEGLFNHLRVDRNVPLQTRAFFSSSTMLYKRMLRSADVGRVLDELGIAPYTFTEAPEQPERDADGLLVLRHTLMNPWLRNNANRIDYIEKYCLYLEQLLRQLVPAYVRISEKSASLH
jgi:glutamate/tyrosine decarboxylase-like PLP-dependent enzyme